MDLKFSHIDRLVENLDEACAYYAHILKARMSKTFVTCGCCRTPTAKG